MYSDIIILAMLANGPMHGYEIKKRAEQILGSPISLNNKVLYPALKRFEEMKAVEREVVRQEGKPDRHMYRMTEYGREWMQMLLQDFSAELLRNDAEFLVRVSFFRLLEPEAQLEILHIRADIVNKKIAHIQEMRKLASTTQGNNEFVEEVISFHEQQNRHELDWIESLIQKIEQA
ncbi:MAG TPA: PadR family transcriptional regulator [Ktedonobacteraceae bacterium]|jgi:DNA-binding PadR family transcriptional regulator|nr:PadR family transcriptional regulator [Ktedonobacteraceae bacterium]